ncbi:hypothetical protein [Haliangium sp.]|uniref:hypothetical protein n=1 Tax=Haliangium sp. TaxID=2663208 RepID=UPI003D0E7790
MDLQTQHAIVVVGAMNPTIHHPQWYQAVELLSQAEAEAALSRNNVVVLPQLAQFEADGLSLECNQSRWQVATTTPTLRARILRIAQGTFQRLYHTPVSAFGMNYQYTREIKESSFERLSGKMTAGMPYPQANALATSATHLDGFNFSFSYPMPALATDTDTEVERTLRVTASVIRLPNPAVQIRANAHHDIVVPAAKEYDLAPIIEQAAHVFDVMEAYAPSLFEYLQGE